MMSMKSDIYNSVCSVLMFLNEVSVLDQNAKVMVGQSPLILKDFWWNDIEIIINFEYVSSKSKQYDEVNF